MFADLQLAYLGLEVPEPDPLCTFFTDVVGLVAGAPIDTTRTLRNDAAAHRLLVSEGAANDATLVGFEAASDDVLTHIAERLAATGQEVEQGSAAQCAQRRVERLVRTRAPWGVPVELVVGLERDSFEAPLVPGGFHTNGVGFGHVVFATTAFDASRDFLVDGLGFRQSDWIEMEIAAGITLHVHFFHCNARHHTIALAATPFDLPQRLHHVMVETNDRDDVGTAFDRAWESGLPLPNGLGRHENDLMFSFYVRSPAEFMVEVGHGAREVHADWDEDRRYERISLWGHQPLR